MGIFHSHSQGSPDSHISELRLPPIPRHRAPATSFHLRNGEVLAYPNDIPDLDPIAYTETLISLSKDPSAADTLGYYLDALPENFPNELMDQLVLHSDRLYFESAINLLGYVVGKSPQAFDPQVTAPKLVRDNFLASVNSPEFLNQAQDVVSFLPDNFPSSLTDKMEYRLSQLYAKENGEKLATLTGVEPHKFDPLIATPNEISATFVAQVQSPEYLNAANLYLTSLPDDFDKSSMTAHLRFLEAKEVTELSAEIAKKYGVEVDVIRKPYTNFWYPNTSMKPLDRHSLAPAALDNLNNELSKYPPEFVRSLGIDGVYIGRDIKNFESENESGKPNEMGGLAIDYWIGEDVLLDASGIGASIHHELEHIIMFASIISNADYEKYVFGGIGNFVKGDYDRTKKFATRRPSDPSPYGGSDLKEHRAEVADRLFADYSKLTQDASASPRLFRAVEIIKAQYYIQSGGKMDQRFWETHAAKQVAPARFWTSYWERREQANDYITNPLAEEFIVAARQQKEEKESR